MARRNNGAADAAASAASDAARTLQARGQEAKQAQEAPTEKADKVQTTDPSRVEKLLENRPHSKAMEDIVNSREEPKEEAPPVEEAAPEAPAEAPAQPEAAAPTEAPVEAKPEAPKTVRVKIDGEESDAPADEVEAYGGLRPYQVAKALENRLRKNSEEQAKFRQEMAGWMQNQAKPVAPPQPTSSELIKSKMPLIRFGTEEEGAAAIEEIIQKAVKNVDPRTVTLQAVSEFEHNIAVKEFDKEFSDLVTNPVLLEAIVSIRNRQLAQLPKGQAVDWKSFYSRIGTQVRNAVPARPSQPAAAPDKTAGTPSQPSDKEARKASIVNLPTAAARAEAPKEEKEPTPEEARKQWIADAKKSRGLG